jgi:hypothetical protein
MIRVLLICILIIGGIHYSAPAAAVLIGCFFIASADWLDSIGKTAPPE